MRLSALVEQREQAVLSVLGEAPLFAQGVEGNICCAHSEDRLDPIDELGRRFRGLPPMRLHPRRPLQLRKQVKRNRIAPENVRNRSGRDADLINRTVGTSGPEMRAEITGQATTARSRPQGGEYSPGGFLARHHGHRRPHDLANRVAITILEQRSLAGNRADV